MSAGASAAAAAEEQRRMAEEEEEMTAYRPDELAQDWEFKIIRSQMGSFGNAEWLRRTLEEEARAGWTLVEKFDNTRVRLKRPVSARERDGKLGLDPYRIYIGPTPAAVGLIVVGIVLGVMLLVIALAAGFLK